MNSSSNKIKPKIGHHFYDTQKKMQKRRSAFLLAETTTTSFLVLSSRRGGRVVLGGEEGVVGQLKKMMATTTTTRHHHRSFSSSKNDALTSSSSSVESARTRTLFLDEIRGRPARRARGQYLPRGGIATSSRSEASKTNDPRESKSSALTIEDEDEFDELTDKWIPEKPVTKAETAGYSVVIILGLGLAASAIFFASKELFMSPKEYAAFNAALKQIELDPRVTSALGESVTGYGSESRNRSQRQRIPHTIVRDPASGREVVRVQFHARGTRGNATVHAEYDPSNAEEPFGYLIVDVERPRAMRLVVKEPRQRRSIMGPGTSLVG
tara:strand:- start:230 stop:1204 length:975 start_codon:yes stop_codon:yes gene_type:complete